MDKQHKQLQPDETGSQYSESEIPDACDWENHPDDLEKQQDGHEEE